jgi:hypothetical protein
MNAKKRERYANDERMRAMCIANSKKNSKPYAEWTEEAKAKASARKRMGRVLGLSGFKPAKHQAHVIAWALHKRAKARSEARAAALARAADSRLVKSLSQEESRQRQLAMYNRLTRELSDGYVSKRLKKNAPLLKGVKLPKELIDLERTRLMIFREVRKVRRDEELQADEK